MKRLGLTVFFIGMLSACSTSPITPGQGDPVPPSRLHSLKSQGGSTLIVTRDSGMFGSGCNYRLYVDNDLAAEFASGEVATFNIAPGKHILGLRTSSACGGGALKESELEIKAGETARRRISLDSGGYYLSPTSY